MGPVRSYPGLQQWPMGGVAPNTVPSIGTGAGAQVGPPTGTYYQPGQNNNFAHSQLRMPMSMGTNVNHFGRGSATPMGMSPGTFLKYPLYTSLNLDQI